MRRIFNESNVMYLLFFADVHNMIENGDELMATNRIIDTSKNQGIGNIYSQDKQKKNILLSTGNIFYGEVTENSSQNLKINIQQNGKNQEMLLQMNSGKDDFKQGDLVKLKILEGTQDTLRVSLEKVTAQGQGAQNHDPTKDKVNVGSGKPVLKTEADSYGGNGSKGVGVVAQGKQIETMLSESEYKTLLKEGYDLTKMSVPMLNQFLQLHQKHTGGDFTSSSVDKIQKFSKQVDKIQNMTTQEAVQFLLSDKTATVSEMYKSLYSGGNQLPEYTMSEKEFQDIQENVEQRLESVAINNSENMLTMSKELVMRGGALDQRSLDVLSFIHQENTNEDILKMAQRQFGNNEKLDAYFIGNIEETKAIPSQEELEKVVLDLKKIEINDVRGLILQNKPVTIQNAIEHKKAEGEEQKSYNLELISPDVAGRVQEEVENLNILRYQMSVKAALRLSLQGLDVRVTPLNTLRQATEALDTEHFVDGGLEIDRSEHAITQNSSESVSKNEIHIMPKDVWQAWQRGMATLNGSTTQVIAQVANDDTVKSVSMNMLLEKAKQGAERYDMLRTEIRPDLGDHIQKAFANVDAILEDLQLEITTYNQRAVEILGRNNMEITPEHIQQIKRIDLPLQELQGKLMPQHIVSLLKDGKDMMSMPLGDLLEQVKQQDKDYEENTIDRMIKSLHHLLKDDELPKQTKDAVVGVYRLMNTISSTHNAAVGFLLERKLPVTLENLFEASKYIQQTKNQQGKMDVALGEEAGLLEKVNMSRPSIMEQISSGYYEKEQKLQAFMQNPLTEEDAVNQVLEKIQGDVEAEDYQKLDRMLEKMSQMPLEMLDKIKAHMDEFTLEEFELFEKIQKEPLNLREVFGKIGNEEIEQLLEAYMQDLDLADPQRKNINQQIQKLKEKMVTKSLKEDVVQESYNQLKDVETHQRLEAKMVEENNYHTLPVMVNQQMQEMHIFYSYQQPTTDRPEPSSAIYMQLTTEHMGTANIRVRFEDRPEVTMFATTEQGQEKMEAYESQIRQVLQELDLSTPQLNYAKFDMPKPLQVSKEEGKRSQHVKRYQDSNYEQVI